MDIKEAEKIFQNAALNLSKEKLHFHTIQVLEKKVKLKSDYSPLGTGVLILVEDSFLVLTACHVIDNYGIDSLYFNTRIGIQRIIGQCHKIETGNNKFTDLAYVILDKMLGILLTETYQFLPITQICHSHIPKETSNYMVCGYPERNFWEKEGDIYTGSSHFLLSMAKKEIYDYYNIDLSNNYILNFAGKGLDIKTGKKSDKIDEPYGMSGCGLWFLQARPEHGKLVLDYFLIGIMTLFKKSKYYVLIGNRIELIMLELERIGLFHFDWNTLSK